MDTSRPDYKLIDGFDKLTKRQMFEMAENHLETTGCPSVKPDCSATCVYTQTGCAASVFIKPEFRKEADQHGNWASLVCADGFKSQHERNFVLALQRAHDRANGDLHVMLPELKPGPERNMHWIRMWHDHMEMIELAAL